MCARFTLICRMLRKIDLTFYLGYLTHPSLFFSKQYVTRFNESVVLWLKKKSLVHARTWVFSVSSNCRINIVKEILIADNLSQISRSVVSYEGELRARVETRADHSTRTLSQKFTEYIHFHVRARAREQ